MKISKAIGRRLLGVLMVACLARSSFALADTAGIPAPADMKAEVLVSGHTSTEKTVDVANVGAQFPYTYTSRPLKNVAGFTCYVSKHFALQTDFSAEQARFMLELLELAFPHYVEAFGVPPDIENRRLPCVYGRSYQSTEAAMRAHGFARGPNGGGEAMFYNGVAYCYPCGNEYHDRYILLHECAHAFQFAVAGTTYSMPGWYTEGMADGLSNHSYEPQTKRLTMFQFNRWGYHNMQADGLADHRANPAWPGGTRGQNVLAVNFLMSDLLRLQKFRIYRDEMFRLDPPSGEIQVESQRLLDELFGPADALAAQYRTWVAGTRQVFSLVEGPWAPEGADFTVADTPSPNLSRLVMDLPPGERLNDFYRFDRVGPKPTPLVGHARCGVAEPVVGCVVNLAAAPGEGSVAGFGLGLVMNTNRPPETGPTPGMGLPGSLNMLVVDGRSLVIDGAALGIPAVSRPLPAATIQALAAGGGRMGITATLGRRKLRVELRAENARPTKPILSVSIPLTAAQRDRLLTGPIALLAHRIACRLTPYVDENQRYVDLDEPAPANLWRNPADNAMARLVKTCWRMGKETPPVLSRMMARLNDAALEGREAQQKSLNRFKAGRDAMAGAIAKTGGAKANAAIADLSGLTLALEHRAYPGREIIAVVRNPTDESARGWVRFSGAAGGGASGDSAVNAITVPSQGRIELTQPIPAKEEEDRRQVVVDSDFAFDGHRLQLSAVTSAQPNPGLSMRFDTACEVTDEIVGVRLIFTGPPREPARGTVVIRADPPESMETAEMTNSVMVPASGIVDIPVLFHWRGHRTPVNLCARASVVLLNEPIELEDTLKTE